MSAVHQPGGAAYDIVLLLHVACVVVGLVTTTAAAATASRLRRVVRSPGPLPDPLRRYFRPGVNWAGRAIYGIPVFGFALLGMSHGAYALTDAWVLIGLVLFVLLALVAECVLWPAERRLQHAVAAAGTPAAGPEPAAPPAAISSGQMTTDAARMEQAASVVLVLLVVATILMIVQP